MSCDLTVHVEIKLNGKWEHYNHVRCFQDYTFFGIVGGVREEGIQIFENKGFPEDLTAITLLNKNKYEDCLHNASWLTPDELLVCVQAFNKQSNDKVAHLLERSFGYLFGGCIWHSINFVRISQKK